jgi:starch-binding outer membrane protein, SusD/RagB family
MNHKILRTTLIAAALGVGLFACKSEFLEPVPQGIYSEQQLTNKQGLNGMLINAYATLDGQEGTQSGGASNWEWGSITGGDAYKGTEFSDRVDDNPIMQYKVTAANPIVRTKWDATFCSYKVGCHL